MARLSAKELPKVPHSAERRTAATEECKQPEQQRPGCGWHSDQLSTERSISVSVAAIILGRIGKFLLLFAVFAMLISFTQQCLHHLGLIAKPVWLLDADVEKSVPTWLAVVLLFLASGLLGLIASCERDLRSRRWRYWLVLAVGFLFMSLDEFLELHERIPLELADFFGLSQQERQILEWFPVPVAAFSLLIFGRFLFGLPLPVRNWLILAGGLYCTGIVAVELVANFVLGGIDHNTFSGAVLVTIEESFELAGVLTLLYAAGRYWLSLLEALEISFDSSLRPIPKPLTAAAGPDALTPVLSRQPQR